MQNTQRFSTVYTWITSHEGAKTTMTRLPNPGGDSGQWGQILNDYLLQSHTASGYLKDGVVTTQQVADGAIAPVKLSNGVQTQLAAISTLEETLEEKVTNVAGVTGFWSGTQAAYDAMSSHNATTVYIITDDPV